MTAVTTSTSLDERTGPFIVKWGINNHEAFDDLDRAVAFAMQLGVDERTTLRIEPATGPILYFPEIEGR
jgi:hypothetical protein